MRHDVTNSTAGKAKLRALTDLDPGFGQCLGAALRVGAISLTTSAATLLQFPAFASEAQTTDCYREPIPPDERPQYFPTGVFGVRGPVEAPLNSCFLRAMHEAPLMSHTTGIAKATYRLLVDPTWGAPFIVRLDIRADGSGILVKKEARSQVEAGTLTVDTSQDVSKDDAEAFDSLVNKADFWSMPTILMQFSRGRWWPVGDMGGIVGVLEGARPGAYHVVTRYLHYNRTPADPYDELTAYLFKNLAHFEIPPVPAIPSKRKH